MSEENSLRLDPKRAALLIVDVQERLAAAMPTEALAALERNVAILVELARRLNLPVVLSEQYPKGLGPTLSAIATSATSANARRIEKLEFGCTDAPAFRDVFRELGRDQWIVAGMETHVCVFQTVRGLVGEGVSAHVPRDAVVSRTPANHEVGLGLMDRAGGVITSTEVVVFDLLQRAGSEDFKAMSKMIK
jgi:nicotinamidase-related amidase